MNYDDLYALAPCYEGREWLKAQERAGLPLAQAWEMCPRGDWLLWLLDKTGNLSDALDLHLQLLALDTPLCDGTERTVLGLISDPCLLAFVELKRRRLAGETITGEDWDAAQTAAKAAAWATAEHAASASIWAVAMTAAKAAAKAAAWGAGWAAAWAVAMTAARAEQWETTRAEQWETTRTAAEAAAKAAAEAAAKAAVQDATLWQANAIRAIVPNPFRGG